ncbi:hypothetical protein [Paenibacillus arenilitoris]|uniref:Uncharacterized protein n=1 Tax=Paenibacillus arenilitoris TaxID=2772299 RepID=A0A927CS00_9BACL|nr:hypothetical protein [Paenibacillus arenilitoris]MBD2872547.1 hypothetical protein [Paenibacillus arenilitoris]
MVLRFISGEDGSHNYQYVTENCDVELIAVRHLLTDIHEYEGNYIFVLGEKQQYQKKAVARKIPQLQELCNTTS